MPIALTLLHDDPFIAVVAKPAGLPVHATLDPRRAHLLGALAEAGCAPTWLVHRLDVETSGLVVVAKQPELVAVLQAQWPTDAVQKRYLALCGRDDVPMQATWSVRNHLAEPRNAQPPVRAVRAGGRRAHTDFRALHVQPKAALVEATLHTGRRHQIRVHLADAGLGILGDADYAPQYLHRAPRLMLHAFELAFTHPVTSVPLALNCPVPADFATAAARLGLQVPA
jgi:RluA family pseudouridine synthase